MSVCFLNYTLCTADGESTESLGEDLWFFDGEKTIPARLLGDEYDSAETIRESQFSAFFADDFVGINHRKGIAKSGQDVFYLIVLKRKNKSRN